MIKLVLTDLDDTLIPAGARGASQRALDAIDGLLEEAIRFGPVTGRVPQSMGWMLGADERRCATGAFSNGQVLYLDGEVVHVEYLDADVLDRLRYYLDIKTYDCALTLHEVEGEPHAVLVTSDPARIGSLRSGTDSYDGVVARVPDRTWVKSNIVCGCDRRAMESLRDRLVREFPELDFVFPSAWAPYIDLLPKGYNKGSAVRILADKLSIGLDEVATFGDSENDLSMIAGFPNSVAVANATEAVKQAAAYQIGPVSDDSVARVLEHICGFGTVM